MYKQIYIFGWGRGGDYFLEKYMGSMVLFNNFHFSLDIIYLNSKIDIYPFFLIAA